MSESESILGASLIQEAKVYYKDNFEGYAEWLRHCATVRSFKPEIPDAEFNPEKFEATQRLLKKTRK